MNSLKLIWWPLLCLFILAACQDDDENQDGNYINTSKMRVKRIVGENAHWGKYELEFTYRADGRLDRVWRIDPTVTEVRDTVGSFYVEYDVDFHKFQIMDYVLNIDADSVNVLKEAYPESYEDTLRTRRVARMYYSTQLENGQFVARKFRPRQNTGSGDMFNTAYVNVSSQTQMLETTASGQPLVIRCYDDVYGTGGENDQYERTVSKYEFTYEGDEMVSGASYKPDSFSETSWTKLKEMSFSHYSGILTGVDADFYKMRRNNTTVVIAEPGRNITYTLNAEGLAVKMETSDGESATIEYENGTGNFSELYATPLERTLGKVWVK